MNQTPTEDKPHPYKQIKVGLINQAPTEEKSFPNNKVGLMNQPLQKKKSFPNKNKSNQYKS